MRRWIHFSLKSPECIWLLPIDRVELNSSWSKASKAVKLELDRLRLVKSLKSPGRMIYHAAAKDSLSGLIYFISSCSRDWCLRKKKKKKRHFQDSSGVCPCLQVGSPSNPHVGQCVNPWSIWFDFLYHLSSTVLCANIVELKWRLMFRCWWVSIKGRHEVKAEWVYISYWERLYILSHLEQHFTGKAWNWNLIQTEAIICSIRAEEHSLYSNTTNILLHYKELKQVCFGLLSIVWRRHFLEKLMKLHIILL